MQRYLRLTFKSLAYELGQRWFGMLSTTPGNAMKADLNVLEKVARTFLTHWREHGGE